MTIHNQLTIHNDQPFFEQALQHGVLSGIITRERVQEIINEAPQGIVQIAGVFGNKNLRPSIEEARIRIVNLVSLYLQATCEGDLDRAALSLQNQSILAHSRGGSTMLKEFHSNSFLDASFDSFKHSSDLTNLYQQFSLQGEGYAKFLSLQEASEENKAKVEAALWCMKQVYQDDMQFQKIHEEYKDTHVMADHVILSFLLSHFHPFNRPMDQLNTTDLKVIVAHVRSKGFGKDVQKALIFDEILKKVPEKQYKIISQLLHRNVSHMLVEMKGHQKGVPDFLPYLNISDTSVLAMSHGESEIMSKWHKITQGNHDLDSFSATTLLLRALTGKSLKITMSQKELGVVIKELKMKDIDVYSQTFIHFLQMNVPFEYQAMFRDIWEEIREEIQDIISGDKNSIEVQDIFISYCSITK